MQLQDILIDAYRCFSKCYNYGCSEKGVFRLWGIKWLWLRTFNALMNASSWIANKTLPGCFRLTRSICTSGNVDIVVSLTSFPARIGYVWLVIETLKRQSLKPQKIILYLSRVQFPEEEASLPENLLALRDELFEIQFVDDDLRSHKKYYYAFRDYPEMNVVTFDDDVFYESHTLERLYEARHRLGECVICGRACVIDPIKKNPWQHTKEPNMPLSNILQIGIAGVLYPPHSYSPHVFDINAIKSCCPKADDIWLNYMCRVNGCKIVMIEGYIDNISVQIKENETLYSENINDNVKQIKELSDWAIKQGLPDYYNA